MQRLKPLLIIVFKAGQLFLSFSFLFIICDPVCDLKYFVVPMTAWETSILNGFHDRYTDKAIVVTTLDPLSLSLWGLFQLSRLWIVTKWPGLWVPVSYAPYKPFAFPCLFIPITLVNGRIFHCGTFQQWLTASVPILLYLGLSWLRFRYESVAG